MSYTAEKKQYGTGPNWYRESPLDLTVTGSYENAEVVVHGYIIAHFTYAADRSGNRNGNKQDLYFYATYCMDAIGKYFNE